MNPFSTVKNAIRRFLGPKILGAIDYLRFPEMRASWGGPLNGQVGRCRMLEEVLNGIPIAAVVETGTFRGSTTSYLAGLVRAPIYTIECNDRNYGFALARFMFARRVHLIHGDSRTGLEQVVKKRVSKDARIFFYLDAHWGEDLPLFEELDSIFSHWEETIVCVDDFRVEGDPGYAFDDYGPGKVLELPYINSLRGKYRLAVFFPALRASEETGARRGCVVLAKSDAVIRKLARVSQLRQFPL